MNIKKIIGNKWFIGASLFATSSIAFAAPVAAFMAAYGSYIATAVSIIGTISSAQAQKDSANYNAQVAENNATAVRQQADARSQQQRVASQKAIGKMEAGFGASGVGMEGSPLEILQQSARDAEMDRLNIIYSGELQARGFENTAGLERSKGSAAMTTGVFKAGSSLLTGSAGSLGKTSSAANPVGVNEGPWAVNNTELPASYLKRVG